MGVRTKQTTWNLFHIIDEQTVKAVVYERGFTLAKQADNC